MAKDATYKSHMEKHFHLKCLLCLYEKYYALTLPFVNKRIRESTTQKNK